jgi:hypothetical protein
LKSNPARQAQGDVPRVKLAGSPVIWRLSNNASIRRIVGMLMGSVEGNVDLLNGLRAKWIGGALLIGASALFVSAEVSINAANGWWADELASLWASDVSLPFTRAFTERITPDTNPPLYYVVLYWVRWLISDDRTAVLAINIAALMIAAGAVFAASQRAGLSRLALWGIAAFGISGPVLVYASEGRNYCLGLAVVFVASWYAALAIKDPHQRPVLASFVIVGAVGGLTHVYAALLCGALGAGLLTSAIFSHRRDLVGPGLALGLSASVVFAIWLSMTWGSLSRVGWIEFSPRLVLRAAHEVETLAIGWHFNLLLFVALLFFGIHDRATRLFFIPFGVAFALFVLLPGVASFKQPIIVGRYWLVGAPALTTLVTFAAWTWFFAGVRLPERRTMRLVAASAAFLFLCTSTMHGVVAAPSQVARKGIWKGAKIVQPLLDDCPAGAVHVATGTGIRRYQYPSPEYFIWGFSKVTRAPSSLFVDAKLQSTPIISPALTRCRVLGWAENNWAASQATDAELLEFLKIEASPDEVEIRRHVTGFVVLKRILSRRSQSLH